MSKNEITHEGKLDINGLIIPCYVLKDGRRVLSGRAMQNALKLVDETADSRSSPGNYIVSFINSKRFNPFIIKDKEVEKFNPIVCYKGNQKISGYEATVLADICDGVLEARRQGVNLNLKQVDIADQCETLIRAFAKIGIIALVDEATGYQYEREKFELQAILQLFISEEIQEWQKIFNLSFYKEIFRLWGIPFTAENIRRKPLFIGKLTNELVYKKMPKGTVVLDKLKEKTPKTEAGNLKYRLHQSLTPEVGREKLKEVINSIETLASVSETKEQFRRLVEKKYGDKNGQLKLSFEELNEKIETKKIAKPTSFDKALKGLLSVPPPKKDSKKK